MSDSTTLRLITIAISHYCEKARWGLDWLKIPYVEESHAPPFHRLYTRPQGGTTVPVLVTKTKTFINSREILHYLDTISSENRQLYLRDRDLSKKIDELEALFDEQLAVACRRLLYFHTLKNPLLVSVMWGIRVPWPEKIGCAIAFPYTRRFVRQKYDITPETAADSMQTIKAVFATISKQLESGKEYLVGNRFSALAAPIIRPEHHPIYSSDLQRLPNEVAAIVRELRETTAGRFALRLYREHRN
jgi:glutathione S-transferase